MYSVYSIVFIQETCLYDMVGEMETDVNEESSLATVVQKNNFSLPEEQNMKAVGLKMCTNIPISVCVLHVNFSLFPTRLNVKTLLWNAAART